jgi:ubiquinone/menaquinone biosynthesis C-methylase UbiE
MPTEPSETDRVRSIYDRRSARTRETGGGADMRWLGGQARGDTLEVGIGQGRSLPYYPADIHLTGIELSPGTLAVAARRSRELGLDVDLRVGDAAALPFPPEHFDTVIFSFSLCTIPDDRAAVAEAVRVLRPGGRIALVEHVRSPWRFVRTVERLVEPIELRRIGDHLLREPLDHVLAEGMEVEYLERRLLGVVERLVARKPETNDLAEAV